MIETMISMAVLMIAMASIMTTLLNGTRLRQVNEDNARARNAAEETLSAIRGMMNIPDAYNRFGGGGAEEIFNIRGLQGLAPNTPAGRVIVWRLKSSLKDRATPPQPDPGSALILSQNELLEAQRAFSDTYPGILDSAANATGTAWDDFLDTNGDTFVDAADDPQVMPVTVRIRWQSQTGVITRYFSAIIGRR
jgi:type II secretory pathway pseudopilin PulG